MDEGDEHSPSKFSITLKVWKLLMQKLQQASQKPGGYWRFYQPTEKCKHALRKNGEEYEPATVSSFQPSIQRYLRLSEKKYPFNILKDSEIEKSRKVLAAKWKSLVLEHSTGNKPQAAQAIRRRGCPFWSRRIRQPQSSCASKNCVVISIPTLRFPSKRQ